MLFRDGSLPLSWFKTISTIFLQEENCKKSLQSQYKRNKESCFRTPWKLILKSFNEWLYMYKIELHILHWIYENWKDVDLKTFRLVFAAYCSWIDSLMSFIALKAYNKKSNIDFTCFSFYSLQSMVLHNTKIKQNIIFSFIFSLSI